MVTKQAVLSVLLSLVSVSTLVAQDVTPEMTPDMLPDTITVASPGLMPEGIEYDPTTDQLLIGSIARGTIHAVAADGTLTPIIESENLTNSVGIQVDAERNRLLVVVTDPSMTKAALGIYDLENGEELVYVDLGALVPDATRAFANDVAVDADGNAYVTDSILGVIYKVDVEGNPSIFLQDASFAGMYTLNGITYHPDGYLLATRMGTLIKIPLDAPEAFITVEAEVRLSGGDGIILLDDMTLIFVSGLQNKVLRLHSEDDFESVTLTGEFRTRPLSPTTAAVRDGEVYVVYAKFTQPTASDYPIQRVEFTEPGT